MGFESPNASVRYDRTDAQVRVTGWEEAVRFHLAASRTDDRLDDPDGRYDGVSPPGTWRSEARDVHARLQGSGVLVPGRLEFDAGAEARGQWGAESFRGEEDPENARKQAAATASLTLLAAGTLDVKVEKEELDDDTRGIGMAINAINDLERHPDRTMVLLAGSGHARKMGIPHQVGNRATIPLAVLLPLAPGIFEPETLTPDDADFVIMP